MEEASNESNPSARPVGLLGFPPEVLLYILSYLDLPDLAIIAQVAPALEPLTDDPVLHTHRLRIVSPSRVNHNLFGMSPQGHIFRPTVGDLVRRGVIKGLGMERRWRMGAYFYSFNSIIQYENSRALSRRHASHVVSLQLRRRTTPGGVNVPLQSLHSCHVLPDVESSYLNVARSLLPVMRKLKWSIQRDQLAKVFKASGACSGLAAWLETSDARRVLKESEKVRLAICPDIRKRVGFFEKMAKA